MRSTRPTVVHAVYGRTISTGGIHFDVGSELHHDTDGTVRGRMRLGDIARGIGELPHGIGDRRKSGSVGLHGRGERLPRVFGVVPRLLRIDGIDRLRGGMAHVIRSGHGIIGARAVDGNEKDAGKSGMAGRAGISR